MGSPWCPVVGQQVFAQPLPRKGHTSVITDFTACFPFQYVLLVKLAHFSSNLASHCSPLHFEKNFGTPALLTVRATIDLWGLHSKMVVVSLVSAQLEARALPPLQSGQPLTHQYLESFWVNKAPAATVSLGSSYSYSLSQVHLLLRISLETQAA